MKTIENANRQAFNENEVNWQELAAIGIQKKVLEENGEMEKLLSGESTGIISLHLTLLGVDVTLDATLRLTKGSDSPILEIVGIKPRK